MPVTKPTAWPTVWPPDGGYVEVATIAAYLNERVYAGRESVNARRVRDGKRPYSSEYEWQTAFLPLFPTDGWETRTDVPRFQIIGPIGVSGRGLHEYMGFPEITERINEMNALAAGSVQPTPAPPPVTDPPPPIVEEPPMPTEPPPDVSQPCGPGEYRNLFDGKCYPIGTAPPPGPVPTPLPPLDDTVADFGDGITLKLFVHDPRLPQIGYGKVVKLEGGTIAFRFNVGGSLQVFVSVIDGRPVNGHWWVMSCGLTDVDCTLVARKGDAKKEYPNVQGQTFPTTLDTTAFKA